MTNVKICGVTNLSDAVVAARAGADLLGFIFYKPSPRYVAPETVKAIVAGLKSEGLKETLRCVGVFVNEPLETVSHTLEFCPLDAVQLHGDEPPTFVQHFNGLAYKAIRPPSAEAAEQLIQTYQPLFPPPAASAPPPLPCLLLDAYHPHLYGGTGRVTDWTIAANVARRYPTMLAGSLTPDNVAEAIAIVRPWGVDVSSGVEAEKGKKDHGKVKVFIENVKRKT